MRRVRAVSAGNSARYSMRPATSTSIAKTVAASGVRKSPAKPAAMPISKKRVAGVFGKVDAGRSSAKRLHRSARLRPRVPRCRQRGASPRAQHNERHETRGDDVFAPVAYVKYRAHAAVGALAPSTVGKHDGKAREGEEGRKQGVMYSSRKTPIARSTRPKRAQMTPTMMPIGIPTAPISTRPL